MSMYDWHNGDDGISALLSKKPDEWTEEEEELAKGFMPQAVNSCGECSFCCVAPAIVKDSGTLRKSDKSIPPKPATVPCLHCESGGGCKIYDDRPRVCSGYMCGYLLGEVETRPDELGVAWSWSMSKEERPRPVVVGHAINLVTVLADPRVYRDIEVYFSRGAAAVAVRSARRSVGFYPTGEAYEVDIDPTDLLKMRELPNTTRRSKHDWKRGR